LQSLVLIGKELKGYYEHTSVGHIAPGPDGKVLFTAGGLFTNETKPIGDAGRRGTGSFTIPSVHDHYYLMVRFNDDFPIPGQKKDPGITVYMPGDTRPLITVPIDLAKIERFRRPGSLGSFPLDKRIHFIPAAKMIVTVALTDDRVVVRRFDVEEAMD